MIGLKTSNTRAHLFICNKQEARRILSAQETDIQTLLRMMRERGPHIAVITDGPNGAYALDGEKMYFVPQYPDIAPPKERTGAGDAFSSTLAAFLAMGYDLKDALLRAPINSMSVVQQIGAQKGTPHTRRYRPLSRESTGRVHGVGAVKITTAAASLSS